jgi:hypothetical protein
LGQIVLKPFVTWSAVLVAALVSFPALAQSQADFVTAFSGKWQVYDKGMAAGATPCQLDLSNLGTDGKLGVTAEGCKAPLAGAHSWAIEGSQLVLYNEQAAALVKLGGNQKRITGTTGDGLPIILERQGGDGTAGLLLAAVNASHCYYLGYTQKCAAKSEATTLPAEGPQPSQAARQPHCPQRAAQRRRQRRNRQARHLCRGAAVCDSVRRSVVQGHARRQHRLAAQAHHPPEPLAGGDLRQFLRLTRRRRRRLQPAPQQFLHRPRGWHAPVR